MYNTFMTTTKRKGQSMRHEETRDNTTAIEALMMTGDAEEILVGLGHSPEAADKMIAVDMDNPAEGWFGAVVTREDDDPEDDGQPSEYEEWQDFMGGDDWDHGQYDDCGW